MASHAPWCNRVRFTVAVLSAAVLSVTCAFHAVVHAASPVPESVMRSKRTTVDAIKIIGSLPRKQQCLSALRQILPTGANQFDQFAPIHLARPVLNGAESPAPKN